LRKGRKYKKDRKGRKDRKESVGSLPDAELVFD